MGNIFITRFSFTLLASLLIQASFAATVIGKLQNDIGVAVSGQTLYLSDGKSAITQKSGAFQFEGLLIGNYELKTEVGGQIVLLNVFVISKEDETLDFDIITMARNIQLKEVAITDRYINKQIERMPDVKDNVIYTAKKNEVVRLSTSSANLAQNNSRQLFAKVPGIQIWESDGSGVQMGIAARGLSPNRMWEFNTRQNGYDISSDPFGYPEAYYTPSVESLERIEIIRGAASLQYGPQFGGVVNYIKKRSISGKKFGVESMQTLGNYGMFSSFNAIGGNYKKFSYYANINYRKSNGWRNNNDYTTWNGFVNFGYQFTSKLKVQFEYSYMNQLVHQPGGTTDSLFKIDPKASTRNRNWFELKWNIPAITADYKISEKQHINVKIFGLYGERNSIGFMSAINIPDSINSTTGQYANRQIDIDKYTNWGTEIRYLLSYMSGKQKQYLSMGARYYSGNTDRIRNNNGDNGTEFSLNEPSTTRSRDLNYTTENIAFFAENLFQVHKHLSFTMGIRLEQLKNTSKGISGTTANNQSSTRNFTLLGFGTQYKTSASTNVYANFTQAYRPVLFTDLTLDRPTDSIDANLKDARGYNIDIGYRGNFGNYLNFDLGIFYLDYKNRIGTYLVSNNVNYRTNIGTSVSKGIESYIEFTPTAFLANSKWGNISIFNTTCLMDARYTQWNNTDAKEDLTNKWVENAPQIIIRTGMTYRIKTFSATIQNSYVSETYSDAKNTFAPTANAQNGIIPSYMIWDFSAAIKLGKFVNANAGVNNIANTAYFTRRAGGYPGPGLLPADGRLIYVGLGVKF
jgi:Fe(3+) dicitrate transport protein